MILSVYKAIVNFLPLLLVVSVMQAMAEDRQTPIPEDAQQHQEVTCSGKFYRAKKSGVPVYDLPDTTARVLKKLDVGEEVCYLGEKDSFAIIDWPIEVAGDTKSKNKDSQKNDSQNKTEGFAYIRAIDLRDPSARVRQSSQQVGSGLFETIKRYYYYIRSGGVPEDALVPYRPLISEISQEPGADLGKCAIDLCESTQGKDSSVSPD